MSEPDVAVDMLIVGAGPAGLFGAYYAGFRGMSVAVMDSLPEPGGQISAMYPEKVIYDVAGFPAIRGRDLVNNLVEQAGAFTPRYLLGEQAAELTHEHEDGGVPGTVVVTSTAGLRVAAKTVVITGGLGTFTPRPLPVGTEFLGRGLVYFVPSLKIYEGKDVLIVGGGDSAFDWALSLQPIAKSVTLVHRRDRFRAHEHSVSKVTDSDVEILTFHEVHSVHGEDEIEAVELRNAKTGDVRRLEVQGVVAALGFTADLGPLTRWGLTIDKRHIVVDTQMWTAVERIFAAGDITDYLGKVRLIATGFGEVATAVNNAAPVIDPAAKVFPGHSSDPGHSSGVA
jgi:ferredoxin/flavodoxin---NADP+ reductase